MSWLLVLPVAASVSAGAEDHAQRIAAAMDYIAGHADREDMVMMPMRGGWDKPVFMTPGQVHKVAMGPLVTSNAFLPGHRIRIEVSSGNFPRFERNLNTGGNNYDEKDPLLAHNVIHHGGQYLSEIVLPVLAGATAGDTTRAVANGR